MAAVYYLSITLRTLGIYTLGLVQAYRINQQRLVFHNSGFPGQCIIKIHLTAIRIMGNEIHVRDERGESDALWCNITWSAFFSLHWQCRNLYAALHWKLPLLGHEVQSWSCPTSIYDRSSTGHLVWRSKARIRYDKHNEESIFCSSIGQPHQLLL